MGNYTGRKNAFYDDLFQESLKKEDEFMSAALPALEDGEAVKSAAMDLLFGCMKALQAHPCSRQ